LGAASRSMKELPRARVATPLKSARVFGVRADMPKSVRCPRGLRATTRQRLGGVPRHSRTLPVSTSPYSSRESGT
jgi:hypothetical protein